MFDAVTRSYHVFRVFACRALLEGFSGCEVKKPLEKNAKKLAKPMEASEPERPVVAGFMKILEFHRAVLSA